jgi:hypothetical protein
MEELIHDQHIYAVVCICMQWCILQLVRDTVATPCLDRVRLNSSKYSIFLSLSIAAQGKTLERQGSEREGGGGGGGGGEAGRNHTARGAQSKVANER